MSWSISPFWPVQRGSCSTNLAVRKQDPLLGQATHSVLRMPSAPSELLSSQGSYARHLLPQHSADLLHPVHSGQSALRLEAARMEASHPGLAGLPQMGGLLGRAEQQQQALNQQMLSQQALSQQTQHSNYAAMSQEPNLLGGSQLGSGEYRGLQGSIPPQFLGSSGEPEHSAAHVGPLLVFQNTT